MATAGNGINVTTSPTTAYDPSVDLPSLAWTITNRTSSTGNILVNVANLHAVGDFVGVPPGLDRTFTNAARGIGKITIKTDTGTATADYGIVRD